MTRDDYMIAQVNVVNNALTQLVLLLGRTYVDLQPELGEIMMKAEAERVALNDMIKQTKVKEEEKG